MDTTKLTNDLWAERKARAIAFLKDKPKPGKGWASKTYEYDLAAPAPAGGRR